MKLFDIFAAITDKAHDISIEEKCSADHISAYCENCLSAYPTDEQIKKLRSKIEEYYKSDWNGTHDSYYKFESELQEEVAV